VDDLVHVRQSHRLRRHVDSDRGWTADIYKKAGMWYVRHMVPDWQPCPDGTAVDGLQLFTFYAATR
jgi:hypothetical protein